VTDPDQVATPKRVACVGDSITLSSYYTVELQQRLGQGYDVEDFGVSGATVLLDTEKPYLGSDAIQYARDFKPDFVIIMLGTNDASANSTFSLNIFESDYSKLVVEFQSFSSRPRIMLVKPPPIYNNELGLSNANLIKSVIPGVDAIAGAFRLPSVDVYTPLTDHPDFFFDGVHPKHVGATVIANEVYAAIVS
jgi:acyl-CoA thioesterase I